MFYINNNITYNIFLISIKLNNYIVIVAVRININIKAIHYNGVVYIGVSALCSASNQYLNLKSTQLTTTY